MEISVRRLKPEEFQAALNLRIEVFVVEQKVPIEEEHDALDAEAVHFGAFQGRELVGTGRLVTAERRGKIGRVAVAKEARGRGVGVAMMDAILNECRRRALKEAFLSAQVGAIGFYQKLGFEVVSEEYLDAGIVHKDMIQMLG